MLSPANYKYIQHTLVDIVLHIKLDDNRKADMEEICQVILQETNNIRYGNLMYLRSIQQDLLNKEPLFYQGDLPFSTENS